MKTLVLALVLASGMTPAAPDQSLNKTDRGYVLGADDVIAVRVQDVEEYNAQNLLPMRIDPGGNIRLPLIGRMNAAGLTTDQFEAKIKGALMALMNAPDVTVTVTEFGSRPVSVLGAVKNPGVHQISGPKTLFQVLSLAGGLSGDAGNSIEITRRVGAGPLPLPGATRDASGQYLVGKLDIRSVMEAKDPAANIDVLPDDVITVPKAELVYVVGAVKRAGGFVLNEKEQMSVLQALSLAEGLDSVAAGSSARILREGTSQSGRDEIPVNVTHILDGSARDVSLRANDILFVPNSKAKNVTLRALEVAVQMGTGIVIYHH